MSLLNNLEVTTPPRDAASVVLLRSTPAGGLEVLLMRRHEKSGVLGGAWVFPGGKVDPADAEAGDGAAALAPPSLRVLVERLGEPGLEDRQAVALYAAAARETLEEAAVALPLDALFPWSRWITPRRPSMMDRRFDTRFFVAVLPPGQRVRPDAFETVEMAWLDPRAALERYWSGEIRLAPPQIMSLAQLARGQDPAAVIAAARSRPPALIEPGSFDIDGMRVTVYPGDSSHPVAEPALAGPSRLYWRNERFEPERGFDGFFD